MTTIATFNKAEQAHLLRSRLEAAGIPAFLLDETVTQMESGFFTGGVRVQVADEEVEAARKLLATTADAP
jgi:hypothetical protein